MKTNTKQVFIQKKVISNEDSILKEIKTKHKKEENEFLKSMIPKAKEFIQRIFSFVEIYFQLLEISVNNVVVKKLFWIDKTKKIMFLIKNSKSLKDLSQFGFLNWCNFIGDM